ncbi:hypothetical protein Tco_0871699 [Tanacetum coccineum]
MDYEPNDVRLSILRRLREDFKAEVALANSLLDMLTRYLDQMRSHGPEMTRVGSLPNHPLINYGLHTLQRTTGADMRNTNNLVAARNELLEALPGEGKEFLTITEQSLLMKSGFSPNPCVSSGNGDISI